MSKSNNASSGFVKLSRGFFDHYLWNETRTFSKAEAFLDLIQRASFAEHKQLIDGQLITLERGEQIASVRYLAKRWAWSKGKVERFLDGLAHDQMVNRKTGHGQTILTLCNYDAYNSTRDTYGDTHGDSNGTPTGTPTGTKDKKGKKDKKVKNIIDGFTKPTIQDMIAYSEEIKMPEYECHKFIDFYESKGWKVGRESMKDWKAAARNWNRRNSGQDHRAAKASKEYQERLEINEL